MGKALFHCAIVLLNTEVHESSLLGGKCLMFAKPTKSRMRLCLFSKPIKLNCHCLIPLLFVRT